MGQTLEPGARPRTHVKLRTRVNLGAKYEEPVRMIKLGQQVICQDFPDTGFPRNDTMTGVVSQTG